MILVSASQILQPVQKRPCISQASSTDKTGPGMAPVILPCHHLCVDGIGTGGPLILLRKYMRNPILHLFHWIQFVIYYLNGLWKKFAEKNNPCVILMGSTFRYGHQGRRNTAGGQHSSSLLHEPYCVLLTEYRSISSAELLILEMSRGLKGGRLFCYLYFIAGFHILSFVCDSMIKMACFLSLLPMAGVVAGWGWCVLPYSMILGLVWPFVEWLSKYPFDCYWVGCALAADAPDEGMGLHYCGECVICFLKGNFPSCSWTLPLPRM